MPYRLLLNLATAIGLLCFISCKGDFTCSCNAGGKISNYRIGKTSSRHATDLCNGYKAQFSDSCMLNEAK